ncbi:MAG: YiiX/YebB-like N1pC/P60 family cysteine hydrolase [Verrucomicrobiota bacterium]
MKFRRSSLGLILALCGAATAAEPKPQALREGDIVFSGSTTGQGGAIIAATGSPYTHCGIVFLRDGKPMVLEAVQPVSVVSLETFKSRSKPGTFMARRLRTALTPANYQMARSWGAAQIGKNYDARFQWNDDTLYCSELVWKIYQHGGVELCEPRRFRDYHLDDPKVRKLVEERYGGIEKMPLDEKVVAPSDLAASPLLVDVPPGS